MQMNGRLVEGKMHGNSGTVLVQLGAEAQELKARLPKHLSS